MKNKGLGSKPKEMAEWKIGAIIITGAVFLTHILAVYVCEWYRVLKSINWYQVLHNYYTFMDRADALFERWM